MMRPPRPLLDHALGRDSGAQEHAPQVDPEHPVEVLRGHVHDQDVRVDPGVVDQDVDTAVRVHGSVDHLGDAFLVGDVGRDGGGDEAVLAELLGR
jgi:hypothetical protein